jgi:lysophospholipase L1-like esterase
MGAGQMIKVTRIDATPKLRITLVAALVLIAATGFGVVVRQSHPAESVAWPGPVAVHPYSQWPMVTTRRVFVLFAGDDFAAGYGGIGTNAYPYILCNAVGLTCHVDAQSGTGLVNDGRRYSATTRRLIDRLPIDAKLYQADVVVVDAGRNDVEASGSDYAVALKEYVQEVNRTWPGAKVVVVLPAYFSDRPDPGYEKRAVITADVVEPLGGVLIDPVARGWFIGQDISSLTSGADGHPNQQGHELIAHKLAEALKELGVTATEGVR